VITPAAPALRAVTRASATRRDAPLVELVEPYEWPIGSIAVVRWMRTFGDVARIGVEGTGSCGARITRHLREAGVEVLEVDRPDRSDRRRKGKNDDLDAISAARAALQGRRSSIPKNKEGAVEALRVLHVTRATVVRAR